MKAIVVKEEVIHRSDGFLIVEKFYKEIEAQRGLDANLEPAGMATEVVCVDVFYTDGTSEIMPLLEG